MTDAVILDVEGAEILIFDGDEPPELLDVTAESILFVEDEPGELVERSEEALIDVSTVEVEVLDARPDDIFLLSEGEQGVPGRDGLNGAAVVELAFAWGDASPRTVVLATGGKLVYAAQIHISTAFDGASPQLQVGDALNAARLMTAAQNDPTTTGTYTSAPVHRYGADTNILLTITPGDGATAGAGLLTLSIEQ